MMKAIGYNRVVLIVLLLAFIAVIFLYNTKILEPAYAKEKRQLSRYKSEISKMTTDLTALRDGLEKFETQKAGFENVQGLGFFNSQDRVKARELITAIQKESRLLSAKYAISPVRTNPNKKAEEAKHKILETDIDFNLEAVEDSDVYKFIYIMNYGFPGQVIIKDFSISRETEITQPLLRKIGVGDSVPVFKSNLKVIWKTMVPLEEAQSSDGNGREGGE